MTNHKFYDSEIYACESEGSLVMLTLPNYIPIMLHKNDIIYLASLFGLVVSEEKI